MSLCRSWYVVVVVVVFFYDAQLVAFVISTSRSTLEKTHFFFPHFFLSRFLLATKTGFKRKREKKKTIINTSRDLSSFHLFLVWNGGEKTATNNGGETRHFTLMRFATRKYVTSCRAARYFLKKKKKDETQPKKKKKCVFFFLFLFFVFFKEK